MTYDNTPETLDDLAIILEAAAKAPVPRWLRKAREAESRRLARAHAAALENARKYHPELIDPETGEVDYLRGFGEE